MGARAKNKSLRGVAATRLLRHMSLSCALCVAAENASAFDGQRKGFVLGFGAGVTRLFGVATDLQTTGAGLDLKIGYALNNQLQLHYTGKTYVMGEGDTVFAFLAPQAGAQYYLLPASRSWFFAGGVGVFAGQRLTENEFDAGGAGWSAYAGVGYQFAAHFYVELDIVPTFEVAHGGFFSAGFLTVHAIAY